jgi:hypothetical protein
LEGCKKITVLRNQFFGDVLGRNIKLISTVPGDLKLGKVQGIVVEK